MDRDSTLDTFIVLGVVWFMWRLLREQRLPVGTLWVLPLLMLLICVWQWRLFASAGPAVVVAAALVGTLSGLVVGRLMFRRVDQHAARVVVEGTPLSVALWPGVVALVIVAQYALRDRIDPATAAQWNVASLAFVVGSLGGQRAYLHWQYTRATRREDGQRGRVGL